MSDSNRTFIRKRDFLAWMEKERPGMYDETLDHFATGGYASWLCYFWIDPEKGKNAYSDAGVGIVNDIPVPVPDARSYFRTALRCIIENSGYDENFSEDTSPLFLNNFEDGRLKLSILLGVAASLQKDVLYIGSGSHTIEKQITDHFVDVKYVDIIDNTDFDTLISVPIDRPVVVNDAFYEGFELDQKRIGTAEIYYAKQHPVKESDYMFLLPGHREVRYTNDHRFKFFFDSVLSRILTSDNSYSVLKGWYTYNIPGIDRYFGINLAKLSGRVTAERFATTENEALVPEILLFSNEDKCKVGDQIVNKHEVIRLVKENGFSEQFFDTAEKIIKLDSRVNTLAAKIFFFSKQNKEAKRLKCQTEQEVVIKELNLYVNFKFNSSQLRNATVTRNYQLTDSEIIDKVYSKVDRKGWIARRTTTRYKHRFKANKQFLATIQSYLKNKTLLDYGCGDGTYTETMSNVLYYDTVDSRLNNKTKWYDGTQQYDAVLFRYVLHHTREVDQLLEYARGKMLFIIEHDPRGCEKDLHSLHAQYEEIPSDYFNGDMCRFLPPKVFPRWAKIFKGGKYNSYMLVYWKYSGHIKEEDSDDEFYDNDLNRLDELI